MKYASIMNGGGGPLPGIPGVVSHVAIELAFEFEPRTFHPTDRVLVHTVAGWLPGVVESEPEPGIYRVHLDDDLPTMIVLAKAMHLECDRPLVVTS